MPEQILFIIRHQAMPRFIYVFALKFYTCVTLFPDLFTNQNMENGKNIENNFNGSSFKKAVFITDSA